ncbi:uncharacterized protein [Rutidosis leptorrhynchoides]|uniref:uncharacterized protein n=1 Tax=Rutidosis leptorrhynchoides TaxID=125765 RepID=UPI003A98D2A7
MDKEVKLETRIIKNDPSNLFCWKWIRPPTGRTLSELNRLCDLLNGFSYENGETDKWAWNLHPSETFYTSVLTKLLDEKILPNANMSFETARLHLLPQKIGILIWRVMQERIPVRVELDKRGVDMDSVRCPVCDDDIETAEHTFLHCEFAKDIWSRIFRWWGSNRHMYSCLGDMFKGDIGGSKSKLWQSIEWVCGYHIWRNRNLTLFQRKRGNGPMALNEVQIKSFEWISKRVRKCSFEWSQWLINPSSYDDQV